MVFVISHAMELGERRKEVKRIKLFFKRFFKKVVGPERPREYIVSDFAVERATEVVVKNFAALHSILAEEKLHGVGDEAKMADLSLALQRHEDQHGDLMKDYLKPYIERWNVVQDPGPDEWHRWYAAGVLRHNEKKIGPERKGPPIS